MDKNILSVWSQLDYDDSINKINWHTMAPYSTSSFGYSDEIRIPIFNSDILTYPAESYLYIEGEFVSGRTGENDGATVFTNNSFAFLFDEIRYLISGVEVDRVNNPGITSCLKNYASLTSANAKHLLNAGWLKADSQQPEVSTFSACIPLKCLLGCFEDYKLCIAHVSQELILIRSRNDVNSMLDTTPQPMSKIDITKINWKIPFVTPSEKYRLSLLKYIKSGKPITMNFRSWNLFETTLPQGENKFSWTLKTASALERPKYVILGFQVNRKYNIRMDASKFDAIQLRNVKLYLNSDVYPHDDLQIDYEKNRFGVIYEMYSRFQSSYYDKNNNEPLHDPTQFRNIAPIVVLDCSNSNSQIMSNTVDVKLEIEARRIFDFHCIAYCLLISDKVIEYTPLTSVVHRVI